MSAVAPVHTARFASAIAAATSPLEAADRACDEALASLAATPNLAIVFYWHGWAPQAESLATRLKERLGTAVVIGCNAETVVGVGREIEDEPALSLWLAYLPGANIEPMRLEFDRSAEGSFISGWPESVVGPWPKESFLIALADPFSFPTDFLLEQLNEDRPGVAAIGGMASGVHRPGGSRLILNDQTHVEGAVVLRLSGDVRLRTVVSQGCRPIGRTFVVTKAERNVIHELGGKPAIVQLRQIFDTLPQREQALVQRGLHVGRVVSEYRERFEQGDFLVRNVVGIDKSTGALGIGDYVRVGQTVQFHIRDAETADAELRQMLAALKPQVAGHAVGALLFSCNGRGTRLFEAPDHDAGAIRDQLGEIPLAGLFAAGEVGPIGGKNFVHGFTASVGVIEGIG